MMRWGGSVFYGGGGGMLECWYGGMVPLLFHRRSSYKLAALPSLSFEQKYCTYSSTSFNLPYQSSFLPTYFALLFSSGEKEEASFIPLL